MSQLRSGFWISVLGLVLALLTARCAAAPTPSAPATSPPASSTQTASASASVTSGRTPGPSGAATSVPTPAVSPAPAATYAVVEPGDTLSGIGRRYYVTVEELLTANPQIADPDRIRVGERIAIPGEFFIGELVTLVDTLGPATPETTFSVYGSGGSTGDIGPLFTLAQPTRITEIGGFVTDLTYGRSRDWLEVEICPVLRNPFEPAPASHFVADCPSAPATFALPRPAPYTYAYESVAPGLILPAGDYVAIFTGRGDAGGSLLWQASDPFAYLPASIAQWYEGSSLPSTSGPLAVRVLGRSLAAWAPTPAPLASPAPPCGASRASPQPVPSPTASPSTIAAAAEAYRALLVASVHPPGDGTSDSSVPCGLVREGACTRARLAAGKAYWRMIAAAEETFVAGLAAIPFPDTVATQVRALRDAADLGRCWADAAANATTVETLNAFAAQAAAAWETRYGPEQVLKEALGLPAGDCGLGCAESPAPSDGGP
jgi:LysM repeat protein